MKVFKNEGKISRMKESRMVVRIFLKKFKKFRKFKKFKLKIKKPLKIDWIFKFIYNFAN